MDKLQSVGLWLREDKDRDRCVSGRVASLLAERGIACLGVAGQHTGGISGVREAEPEEIAREVSEKLRHSATQLQALGTYSHTEKASIKPVSASVICR